jgi:hypothetical protein
MFEKFEKLGPGTLIVAFGGFFLAVFIVFEVLNLEFFRGDPDLGGHATPIRDGNAALAHEQCARAVSGNLGLDPQAGGGSDYTAWDIGFGRYLVKAAVPSGGKGAAAGHYLCTVLRQADRWAVQSLEYVD